MVRGTQRKRGHATHARELQRQPGLSRPLALRNHAGKVSRAASCRTSLLLADDIERRATGTASRLRRVHHADQKRTIFSDSIVVWREGDRRATGAPRFPCADAPRVRLATVPSPRRRVGLSAGALQVPVTATRVLQVQSGAMRPASGAGGAALVVLS